MLSNLTLDPFLNLPWCNFALGSILDGNVGTRPFFIVKCYANNGSVGNRGMFKKNRFKLCRRYLEGVDLDEFLVFVSSTYMFLYRKKCTFLRSTIQKYPLLSHTATSPVRSHLSGLIDSSVAFSFFQYLKQT